MRNDSIVLFPKIDARRRLCLVRSPLHSTSETKKLDSLLTVASRFSDIHIHRSGSRDPSVAQTVSIWTHYLAFGVLLFFLWIDSLQFSNIIRPNSSYIVNHFNFNVFLCYIQYRFVISKSYNVKNSVDFYVRALKRFVFIKSCQWTLNKRNSSVKIEILSQMWMEILYSLLFLTSAHIAFYINTDRSRTFFVRRKCYYSNSLNKNRDSFKCLL